MIDSATVFPRVRAMGSVGGVSGGRTYAAALAVLMADPATSYRLRQLVLEDEVLQRAAVLADDELLLRLDALVRDDVEARGPRDVPPGRVLRTG